MDIWYDTNATDEEIRNCQGDYIGCEICRNAGRCLNMMLERLDKAIRKEEEALPEDASLVTNFNKSDRPLFEKAIELSEHHELYITDDAVDIYGNRLSHLLALRSRECTSLSYFWNVYNQIREESER